LGAYVDTNVILARYILSDPHNDSCRKFFEQTEMERLGSSLSLLELSCVYSRLLEAKEIDVPRRIEVLLSELSHEEKVRGLLEYTLRDCNLKITDVDPIPLTISLLGSPTRVSHIYLKALSLASQLRLKTLDTLHLAHASCLKDEGVQIEYLVTNDVEILAKREQISQILQGRVLSAEEALTL